MAANVEVADSISEQSYKMKGPPGQLSQENEYRKSVMKYNRQQKHILVKIPSLFLTGHSGRNDNPLDPIYVSRRQYNYIG